MRDLEDADASCGAKAHSLATLLAAGLPVPAGFVVTDQAFRSVVPRVETLDLTDVDHIGQILDQLAADIETSHPAPELDDAVAERALRLGRLAVRSSVSLEDRGAGAAAGVFSSRIAVAPEHVWAAIRAVWTSVCTPLVVAYARHLATETPLAVAVIVQRYVPGDRLTIYTREPGQPTSALAWVQRSSVVRKLARTSDDPALELALRAERALGLEHGGADVELIAVTDEQTVSAAGFVVVQARAIVHPPAATRSAAPAMVVSSLLADGRRWTADLAHNPDPLSPAQSGLVERIEREKASPYALRLCAGTLYSTPVAGVEIAAPTSIEELRQRFNAIEQRLVAVLGAEVADDLAETVSAYLRFYRIWAFEMSPLVALARRTVLQPNRSPVQTPHPVTPVPGAGSRPSSVEAMVIACARAEISEAELMNRVGDLSPAWDVAVPTLAETPQAIATALTRARALIARRSREQIADPPARDVGMAELAADLAEVDDLWFARAQARVRRALLTRGEALAIGGDVFWLPLEEIIHSNPIDPETAHAKASAARSAHRRAAQWRMPPVIGADQEIPARRWHGVGSGGVISGRVVHIHSLWDLPTLPVGAIAVTPAVTPALAVALLGAAAIVSETGGLLDHGAAMARELGIPCVVNCADAMSLPAHVLVLVDGANGVVTPLEGW